MNCSQLSFGQTLAYACGGVSLTLPNLVISQWLLVRYLGERGDAPLIPGFMALSAGVTFGIMFALGRVTDGVTDPLVAYWSDHCRSRLGRRVPFVLFGVIPFGLVFYLLWVPPSMESSTLNAIYLFFLLQAYFILYTVVVAPYLALIPEIVSNTHERVNLTTVQAFFVMIGTLLFGLTALLIPAGWWVMGLTFATLTVLTLVPTLLFIREPSGGAPSKDGSVNLLRWVGVTLRNRSFLPVALATSFYWFGLNMLLLLVPLWVTNVLSLETTDTTKVMFPFLGANLVFLFVFNALARRLGKFITFLFVLGSTGLVLPLFCFVGMEFLPGSLLGQTAIVMALAGIPSAGFMVLQMAVLSDVAHHDSACTSIRREGIFFGVQAVFQKSAIGLSIPAFAALAQLGGDGQLVTTFGLKVASVVAGVSCGIAALVFLRYPLREQDDGTVAIADAQS
jgi:GPH family glycoside/pentoside/hexuronide:cation symporter